MSCNCTGSLESENAALKEKLATISAAWQKVAQVDQYRALWDQINGKRKAKERAA